MLHQHTHNHPLSKARLRMACRSHDDVNQSLYENIPLHPTTLASTCEFPGFQYQFTQQKQCKFSTRKVSLYYQSLQATVMQSTRILTIVYLSTTVNDESHNYNANLPDTDKDR